MVALCGIGVCVGGSLLVIWILLPMTVGSLRKLEL